MSIMTVNLKTKNLLTVIIKIQIIYSIRIQHPINHNHNYNNNNNNHYLKENLFKNIQLKLMKIKTLNIKIIMTHLIIKYKIKIQLLLRKMKIIINKNNNFKNRKMKCLKVK